MTIARTAASTNEAELFQAMSELISLREKVAQAELRARAALLKREAQHQENTKSAWSASPIDMCWNRAMRPEEVWIDTNSHCVFWTGSTGRCSCPTTETARPKRGRPTISRCRRTTPCPGPQKKVLSRQGRKGKGAEARFGPLHQSVYGYDREGPGRRAKDQAVRFAIPGIRSRLLARVQIHPRGRGARPSVTKRELTGRPFPPRIMRPSSTVLVAESGHAYLAIHCAPWGRSRHLPCAG